WRCRDPRLARPPPRVRSRVDEPPRSISGPLPRRSSGSPRRRLLPHVPGGRSRRLGRLGMTADLDPRSLRRRFLALIALRWLPVGLMMPIFVLVPLGRGLTLTEIGVVFAAQGLVVLALELPTGGLSDALGRRPVLLLASVIAIVSMSIFAIAQSAELFLVAMVLQGIYRALDSGPLEAWFVDVTLAADPRAEIEHGLGRGSAALSVAIAVGALVSGGLVA